MQGRTEERDTVSEVVTGRMLAIFMEASDWAATCKNVGLSEPTNTRIGVDMSTTGKGVVGMRTRGVTDAERGVPTLERRHPKRGGEKLSGEMRGVMTSRGVDDVAMIGSGVGDGWLRERRLKAGGEVGRVRA